MEVTSKLVPVSGSPTGTMNPAATPELSIVHRHSPIRFKDGEGNTGCQAYAINYDEVYNLKGRLLTLVDATFTDPQQRKAHKDVVWQTLQAWMGDIERAAGLVPLGSSHYDENSPIP